MARFKAGDKVLVRTDMEMGKLYHMRDGSESNNMGMGMRQFFGKEVTIKCLSFGQYLIEEDTVGYSWVDGMFDTN